MWTGGVRVIVLDKNKNMLMVKQEHESGEIWMVPGGQIEENETAAQAAVREVKEETGLDIRAGELIWHVEEVSGRGQRFVNYFLGYLTGESVPVLGQDPEFDEGGQVLRDVRFMSRDEIRKLPRVYPVYLKEEIWQLIEKSSVYDAFKIRD